MEILDLIKKTNPWHKPGYKFNDHIIVREKYLEQLKAKNDFVKILIGPRRVGKSCIIYAYIRDYCARNPDKNIMFLSGDTLNNMSLVDAVESYSADKKIEPHRIVLIVDEVQELKNWASETKILYDFYRMKIIVTGSSSSAISEKMSKLTGRHVIINVTSLSFYEYVKFVKIKQPKMLRKNIFEQYLSLGGYPEQFNDNEIIPGEYLKHALDASLYRDITSLFGVNNPKYLRQILEVLSDNVTNTTSFNNIAKRLAISDETSKNYIEYLQSAFLVYRLYRYGRSNKIRKNSIPKYYLSDIGMLNLLSATPRVGHKLENLVYLKLLQSKSFSLSDEIFYDLLGDNNFEIDFKIDDEYYEVKDTLTKDQAENIVDFAETNGVKINIIARKFNVISKSSYVSNINIEDFLTS